MTRPHRWPTTRDIMGEVAPAPIAAIGRDHYARFGDGRVFVVLECTWCDRHHDIYGAWTTTSVRRAVGERFRHCPTRGASFRMLQIDPAGLIPEFEANPKDPGDARVPPDLRGQVQWLFEHRGSGEFGWTWEIGDWSWTAKRERGAA